MDVRSSVEILYATAQSHVDPESMEQQGFLRYIHLGRGVEGVVVSYQTSGNSRLVLPTDQAPLFTGLQILDHTSLYMD